MTTIPVLPENDRIRESRKKWLHDGSNRPEFADETPEGTLSVWDFPRPPVIEQVEAVLRVFNAKTLIAETHAGVRVIETAGAPTYYFPPTDVEPDLITFGDMASICEWKGVAQSLTVDGIIEAGWRYVRMFEAYTNLYQWCSFYPQKLLCFVDTELVSHQPGGFYGGWVTADLRGPLKGAPGTETW
ncbi:MAG: DUF427 domain-containing protein [Pseudomonadota bacterium]|nr:DUF427 domain-containing protein [Pseudomonadota bacterium]